MAGTGQRIAGMLSGIAVGVVLALSVPSFASGGSPGVSAPQPTVPATTTASDIGQRTVSVTGTASLRSTPDEAVVSFGVQTQSPSAEDAMRENGTRMVSVLRALAELGLKDDDISTTSVSLYPSYGSDGTNISGYQASNQVSVTFHDLDLIGHAIDVAVKAGANLTNGVMFQMSPANRGSEQALATAIVDARSKASAMAAATDAQLGRVLTMTESGSPSVYPPIPYDTAVAGAEATAVPVNPPTLETQVSVQVTWELT
ncbi:MAG: SIMPL domain-containing protein [Actinomycetota bacterium]